MENKNETFKDRLEKLLEVKKSNPNSLATELGTSPVNIYGYLSGKADSPSSKMIRKFERIGVNTDWLLHGKGEMFHNVNDAVVGSGSPEEYFEQLFLRLEESFRDTYDKALAEKDKIISDQRYMLDYMRSQLASPGKLEPTTEQKAGVFTFEKRLPEVA